ncbi:MAG: hypothetical protein JWR03_1241 [Cohnella sp.]|nr:hypothetical protein [Cohnella sp.]
MRKSLYAILATVIVLGLILSGCGSKKISGTASDSGGQPASSGSSSPASNEKVTLKLAFFQGGYGDVWFKYLKDQFEAKHPNVTVELEGNPKMGDLIVPRIEGNTNVPDVMFLNGLDQMKKWGPSGKLIDLTDLYTTPMPDGKTIQDTATETALKSQEWLGKRYSVPWSQSPLGIVYNVDIFEKNGWTYPTTWEDMTKLANEMKAKGIAPFTYPGIYAGYLSALVFPAYTQFGGDEFINKLTNPKDSDIPGLYKDEAFLKTFTQLQSIFKNGWIMKGTQALDHTASQMEFLNGKAAMIYNGAWMENEMKKSLPPGFRMRIMPIPPSADAKVKEMMAVADSRDWGGIPSASKHIDVAKQFLLLASTEESNRKFTELTGAPRAFKYSIDGMNLSDFTKSAIEMLSKYKTVSYIYSPEAINTGGATPDSPSGVDFYSAIASGDMTPQQVIDKNVKAAPDKWKEQQKAIAGKK